MKVKVIKLDERFDRTDREYNEILGKVFDALPYKNDYEEDGYKDNYGLGLEDRIYHIPAQCCEIVSEGIALQENGMTTLFQNRVLMVEDGSVDIDGVEEWCEEQNIKLIVYRQGANKPEWL